MERLATWLADERSRAAWRALLVVLVLAVLWLALTPVPPRLADGVWDKLQHAAAFAALAVTARFGRVTPPGSGFVLVAAALAFGAAIELMQGMVPGRVPEWHDLLADGVGFGAGLLMASAAMAAARRVSGLRR